MEHSSVATRRFCVLSGLSGIIGVSLLVVSFAINNGPPPDPSSSELLAFGRQHFSQILWGAWLQTVGPVLIVAFAFALVQLAGAAQRLSGWMTFFGATVLMTVSLIEISFYIGALNPDPPTMPSISLRLIYAVQHLYFVVAAPSLFLPLGVVLFQSPVLPRVFAYLALFLAAGFAALGLVYLLTPILPIWVTALAGVQALWWLAAAIALMVKGVKTRPRQVSGALA
jgi:hypothetical protein